MEVIRLFKPVHPLWHTVRSRLGTSIPVAAFARNPWRMLLAIQAGGSNHS